MYTIFSDLQWKIKFKLIEVYALNGPSGTGKSHNAFSVMERFDIHTIIDDGIIIHQGSIIAGKSAKKAATTMEAVRRAIFYDEEHKKEVEDSIKKINPKRILVLGTSEKMLFKITKRLGLAKPIKIISIFDIVSKDDLKKAKYFRKIENKHIIPVSAIEVAKTFPGGVVDYIDQIFSRKKKMEKSVVRPSFNVIGKTIISKRVIVKYIYTFFREFDSGKLVDFHLQYNKSFSNKGISIKVFIKIFYGINIKKKCAVLQSSLKNYIEFYIGIEVNSIDIRIVEIVKDEI